MGMISNKRMLPLIILAVLWVYADEEHPISSDELVEKVLEIYQPKGTTVSMSTKRLIKSYLKEIRFFLEDLKEYGIISSPLMIAEKTLGGEGRGYRKGYYIENRVLDDVEIRMLCDAILFSPGMTDAAAKELIEKLISLSSRYFLNVHRYIQINNIILKTHNEEVFRHIGILGEAIENKEMVTFIYKKERKIKVSPYYLVVYNGRYYCIGNETDTEILWHYRLDRISDSQSLGEDARQMHTLEGVEKGFSLDSYLKCHPRMTVDVVVKVVLIVRREFVDIVKQEFYVEHEYPDFTVEAESIRRVRVVACKQALCNWLINVPHLAWVERGDSSGVSEDLVVRAEKIREVYGNP